MAILYISPTGSGTRDGSSLANAGTISNLSSLIGKAGPGGQVLLRADQGAFNLSGQITIKNGSAGAPVTIRGVDANGNTKIAQINGTRATDWTTDKAVGSEVFRLLSGADHLKFEDMAFSNIGDGAFRIGADITDLTLQDMQATNVKRFLANTVSTGYSSASVNGLTVRNVEVNKYSHNAIKLQYNSSNIVIEDVIGRGDPGTPEQYVFGVSLDGTAHDVLFRNVTMQNSYARGASNVYWNGDGFTTEGGNYNIRFDNTVAFGNTDAGYDLKSSNTVLVNAIAIGNNRNYRFWSDSITMESSQSLDPKYFGGSASTDHFWLGDGAHGTMTAGYISDQNAGLTVFDLWKTGAVLEVYDTRIATAGKLSGLGSNSQVLLTTAPTPAPTPLPTPTPSDDPVVAADDFYAATEDAVLTVDATKGVLANDTAADGGKTAVAGTFATAQGGSVKLAADGSFVYTPKADFYGTDSFTYTAKDADGDTDTGAVTFKVADAAETTPAADPDPNSLAAADHHDDDQRDEQIGGADGNLGQ